MEDFDIDSEDFDDVHHSIENSRDDEPNVLDLPISG